MRFRTRSVFRLSIAPLAALSLASHGAAALELYSVDYSGPATLYGMDQTAGTATAVGPVGVSDIVDLTSDTRPGTTTLWGVRLGDGASADELVTIDPATGAAIGSVPLTLLTGGAFAGAPGHMTSIAFDPVSGELYGNTTDAFGAPFDALYSIDPASGVANYIGRIAFDNVYALGFGQTGVLYGVSDLTKELIHIDLTTGNGSAIANLPVMTAYDIASRPSDDVMFLIDSITSSLFTMDVTNGALTGVGPFGDSINRVGLAFAPIPEPGTLLLVLSGLLVLGRQRRTR